MSQQEALEFIDDRIRNAKDALDRATDQRPDALPYLAGQMERVEQWAREAKLAAWDFLNKVQSEKLGVSGECQS